MWDESDVRCKLERCPSHGGELVRPVSGGRETVGGIEVKVNSMFCRLGLGSRFILLITFCGFDTLGCFFGFSRRRGRFFGVEDGAEPRTLQV